MPCLGARGRLTELPMCYAASLLDGVDFGVHRADADSDAMDSLEINEAFVRIGMLYGPGYVRCVGAYVCAVARVFQEPRIPSTVVCVVSVVVVVRATRRLLHSKRERYGDMETDEAYADALFEFIMYLYTRRPMGSPEFAGN